MHTNPKFDFEKILEKAISCIEQNYINFLIANGSQIFRERVYCYELYHQMRKIWPKNGYVINGEVDKKGHPWIVKNGLKSKIPDFVIHSPGNMENNDTIVEVKHAKAHGKGVRKDFETLSTFRRELSYKNGIMLFFGGPVCKEKILHASKDACENIVVYAHTCGNSVKRLGTLKEIRNAWCLQRSKCRLNRCSCH